MLPSKRYAAVCHARKSSVYIALAALVGGLCLFVEMHAHTDATVRLSPLYRILRDWGLACFFVRLVQVIGFYNGNKLTGYVLITTTTWLLTLSAMLFIRVSAPIMNRFAWRFFFFEMIMSTASFAQIC